MTIESCLCSKDKKQKTLFENYISVCGNKNPRFFKTQEPEVTEFVNIKTPFFHLSIKKNEISITRFLALYVVLSKRLLVFDSLYFLIRIIDTSSLKMYRMRCSKRHYITNCKKYSKHKLNNIIKK